MSLTTSEIREILELLEASGWDEAEVTVGDVTLAISKTGRPVGSSGSATATVAAPAPAPVAASTPSSVPASPAADTNGDVEGEPVTAPSVGVFWRSPEPGAPPFVEEGDHVDAGATLCIVEVMKLMNHVTAPVSGIVVGIHVKNSEHVQFGDRLFTVRPDGA